MLPSPQFHRRKQQRHRCDDTPKRDDRPCHRPPPVLLLTQLEVAQRWKYVRQDTRRCSADDLEHRAEITHLRRNNRRTPNQPSGQSNVYDGASVVGG